MLKTGQGGRSVFRFNIFMRLIEDIKLMPAMIRDYWEGRYRKIPLWTFGAIVFAVLYVLSPLDAIPDYILGLGQLDDAFVIWLCLLLMEKDLIPYRQWKRNRLS